MSFGSLSMLSATPINQIALSVRSTPALIAHRGACAYRPEHTLASYELAIEMGAEWIEPDLGVLVCRHENDITGTTNIAELPQFSHLQKNKTVDGRVHTGWFTEDFTLAEIKTLYARERIPELRPANTKYTTLRIATFEEVIKLAQKHGVGIVPELKHPSYFKSIGLPLEQRLLDALSTHGLEVLGTKVLIQSFEVWNLQWLRSRTHAKLLQLIDAPPDKRPFDFVLSGDKRTYADMLTKDGLAAIAKYADIVSPYKEYVIPRTMNNEMGKATTLVHDAHAVGLQVHIFTLRPENAFLPVSLRGSGGLEEIGDSASEITAYLETGIDGFFTDATDIGHKAVQDFLKKKKT